MGFSGHTNKKRDFVMKNILNYQIITLSLLSIHMVSFGVSVRELLGGGVGNLDASRYLRPSVSDGLILDLDGKEITSLDGLADIARVSDVSYINLSDNQISAIKQKELAGLNMMILYLENNQIVDISPDAFGKSNIIQAGYWVSLRNNPILEDKDKMIALKERYPKIVWMDGWNVPVFIGE